MKFIFILFLTCLAACLFSEERYEVVFEGVPNEEILLILNETSQLKTLQARPPSHFFSLKNRAENDLNELLKVFHAFGYYDCQIHIQYEGDFPHTTVIIYFQPGPVYTIGSFLITNKENLNDYPLDCLNIDCLDLQICADAEGAYVINAQENLIEQLASLGFPLAQVIEKNIVVDKERKQLYVTFIIDSGPEALFGPIHIEGLTSIDKQFVLNRILWEENSLYDPMKLKRTDAYLQESGLFSEVIVEIGTEVDENGCLPIFIYLSELKHRHIGAGLTFSTDESIGVIFQWNHENFCHRGQELAFTAEASEVIKRACAFYTIPDFYCPYQELVYLTEIKREDTRGFVEREASFAIRIDRQIGKRRSVSYGVRFERLLSTESDNNDNYNLVSIPLLFYWDRSNDLYNPTKGSHIIYKITPYQNFFNSSIFFLKQEFCLTMYFPILDQNFIFAASAQIGMISGQSRINIPAPKRFYAGSACDLRGYAYKTVSPLKNDKPIGGRSYLIFQVEPRIKIAQKLYLVTFFDCGNVYAEAFPDFDMRFRRSLGLGLRYLTKLGPLRFDVAFPLDRRKDIDSSFQIYASIGQTF